MKKFTLAFSLTLVVCVLLVSGCSVLATRPTPAPLPTFTPLSLTPTPISTFTDDAGRVVQIAGSVERIVSLSPSNTEILFALGLGDRVVGVTDFCDYPPEAASIEKIGGIEPNLEKILALEPDLVLAIGGSRQLETVAKLKELGLKVLVLAPTDLEGIYHDIQLVADACGVPEAGAALVQEMQTRVQSVLDTVASTNTRPKIFYELDATDPNRPWTPGPGTWHDKFISMAGGVNIAANAEAAWAQYSSEDIIAQNPDVILLGDALWGISPEMVAARPGWDAITAVRNGAVYPIDDNLISRPGPRVVQGLETLARLIHPEVFPQ
ncbi:MAG: cobalamin-binding protein [Chloroflexi bacterium]|nr:cobalamin-binding protein [Chloroflexota bacterium]